MKTNNTNAMEIIEAIKSAKSVTGIYHKIDFDGFNCAAILRSVRPDVNLVPWNYNDPLPVIDSELIVVMDVTLPSEWMEMYAERIIWIDHHEPVVIGLRNKGYNPLADFCDFGLGACIIMADLFNMNSLHVKLCASYDTFDRKGTLIDWESTWSYQLYLSSKYNTRVLSPSECVNIAEELLYASNKEILECIAVGLILEKDRAENEEVLMKTAIDTNIGDYKVAKLISDDIPSLAIRSSLEEASYDAFIMRRSSSLPDGSYLVSIRVPESSDFNATEFAKNYNGGGHIKASGCSMTLEQWEAL